MRIAIINGPNLNLLGKREPEVYGATSFEEFLKGVKQDYSDHEMDYYQSNHEGELVDKIQEFGFSHDAIVVNPAAYSHTSVAIRDALSAVPARIVEVHISNIFSREEFRHHSYISAVAEAVVSGMGLKSYTSALDFLISEHE